MKLSYRYKLFMIQKLKLLKARIFPNKDQKEHLKILNHVIDQRDRVQIMDFLLINKVLQRN